MNHEKNVKIIVRLPNWIGDCVLATPFLHALSYLHPRSEIHYLGKRRIRGIFKNFPGYHVFHEMESLGGGHCSFSLLRKLRREAFDRGYLLTNSFGSALSFFIGGVKIRVAYATDGRRLLLNNAVIPHGPVMEESMVEYYLNLLSHETDLKNLKRILRLYPDESDRLKVRKKLMDSGWNGTKSLVGINPFAYQWETKRWFPERFAELTNRLSLERDVQCVFTGIAKDRILFEKIRDMTDVPVIDLVGRVSLEEVPALLGEYNLFVTNDSGLMHVAAAVGTPITAIFGPTDFKRTAPYTEKCTLLRSPQDHEPCMNAVCRRSRQCMRDISVDEVFNACLFWLQQ